MNLESYITDLHRKGRYAFLKAEAIQALNCSQEAFIQAAARLRLKKRICHIYAGFWVIIPPEYASWGILPANWFIDGLMNYLEQPYYVGLLSAAAIYGAGNQQPQQFQVIVPERRRAIRKGKIQIHFYKHALVSKVPCQQVQTETGYMKVSSPETTALDLVKFHVSAGYLSNVATVLAELGESINPDNLHRLAVSGLYDWPTIQRLGYLWSLETVNGKELAAVLQPVVEQHRPRYVPLAPGHEHENSKKNIDWRVFINEDVEPDL